MHLKLGSIGVRSPLFFIFGGTLTDPAKPGKAALMHG
jgi:hypothetical protein